MNKVFEIGRTTNDIELKHTPSGTAIVSFGIAVKRDFKNPEGNYDSDFFECVAFNKLAETLSRFVRKGDRIGVVGNLQSRTFIDKQGNNRKVIEIVVKEIEFLQPKKDETVKAEFNVEEQNYTDPFPFEGELDDDPFADTDIPF